MSDPSRNFEGLSNRDGAFVPDANGNAGPNHYVQWVNYSFAVYSKTGRLLFGPAAGNTLWRGFGGPCEEHNDGDPIVKYDDLADRWLMSQVAWPEDGPYYQCLAISETPDPTGRYYRYAFVIDEKSEHDYSKFAVWPDAYYMSFNLAECEGKACPFSGQGAAAFEREQMLVGDPDAQMVLFRLPFRPGRLVGGTLPSDLNGSPPPPGSPNFFVEVVFPELHPTFQHRLRIYRFHVDWDDVSASTISAPMNLNTDTFNAIVCEEEYCVPQPATKQRLVALSDRLMSRLQYRNFGDHESLVANHTVNVGDNRAGIRWYELRKSGGNDWTIFQQGTYAPDDGEHRWMGSMGMDRAGNIALGYSVSGNSTFPSIRYAGRLANDPLGTLPLGETELVAGGGSQLESDTEGRWGDYSMMAIDPRDDCTFWYTQQYYATGSPGHWQTRIGAFHFPGCVSALPDFSISAGSTSATRRGRRQLTR